MTLQSAVVMVRVPGQILVLVVQCTLEVNVINTRVMASCSQAYRSAPVMVRALNQIHVPAVQDM